LIRASALGGAALILIAVSGCTVRPLLATPPEGTAGGTFAADLSSLSINPVDTRYAQRVRNELVFLLQGGATQPVAPRYKLTLSVGRTITSAVQIQRGDENEPTAGTVTLTGDYRLADAETGATVAQGRRQVTSAFDRPRQEFAVLRAERNAEDRAARELAEQLRLAVAQDMVRLNLR